MKKQMDAVIDCLKKIINLPTVSGFESQSAQQIAMLLVEFSDNFFDGYTILPSGGILFERKCGKPDAKKIVIDAHIDTIGFAISEICENGFVKVINLGGVDPYILPATPVTLLGKRHIQGVFTSVPPHLSGSSKEKLSLSHLYVDTGLSEDTVREICPVGTPVTFASHPVLLKNNIFASSGLDDKACVLSAMLACRILSECKDEIKCDVYVHLASGEEKTMAGAKTLPYVVDADACIVLDVNFAKAEGVEDYLSYSVGKGPGISYSSTTKRELTEFLSETAEKYSIPLQKMVEMRSTGTNATHIHRNGLCSAVLSLPLKNMHTTCECVSLDDVVLCAQLLSKVICDFDLYKYAGVINLK